MSAVRRVLKWPVPVHLGSTIAGPFVWHVYAAPLPEVSRG